MFPHQMWSVIKNYSSKRELASVCQWDKVITGVLLILSVKIQLALFGLQISAVAPGHLV